MKDKNNKIGKDITNKIANEYERVKSSQNIKSENEIEVNTINKFEKENEEIKNNQTNKIEIENEEIKNNQKSKIENEKEEIKEEDIQIIRNESENEDKKISNPLDYEVENIRINQSFPQNKEKIEKIRENKIEKKIKNEIYSTKICTLCGYLYIKKQNAKKSACVCYYYTNKCTWFKKKCVISM